MIKINIIVILSIIIMLLSCDEIDNYKIPNGEISGILNDALTGEGLQTEQPNGFTIKLFEKGGNINSPISFYGKPDGTFKNALIFQNEYKVTASEGAFFPIDTIQVQIGSETVVNFDVMPFLAVTNVVVTPSTGQITASYEIARDKVGDKISARKTLVSKVPTVSNDVYDYIHQEDLSNISDGEILTNKYSDVVKNLPSGEYYVRIAVRTNNSLRRYNYSKIFPVSVP